MSAVHFSRTSNPLKLVFLHATDFNALAYKTLLELMGIHAVALDMRGHGMSELPTDPAILRNWYIHKRDVSTFLHRYVDEPVILAGHSSGAVTSILSAENNPKVSGVVAFDTPTMPLLVRLMPYIPGGTRYTFRRFPIASNAGTRRAVFPDMETAFNRYKGRGTFRGVGDEALHDYLGGGMKPHPEGMQLSCDPKWEQAMFVAQGHSIFKAARNAPQHTRIIYAGKDGPSTKGTRAKMTRILGDGKVETRPDFRHFFPFHAIETTRQMLADMINPVSLSR